MTDNTPNPLIPLRPCVCGVVPLLMKCEPDNFYSEKYRIICMEPECPIRPDRTYTNKQEALETWNKPRSYDKLLVKARDALEHCVITSLNPLWVDPLDNTMKFNPRYEMAKKTITALTTYIANHEQGE